MAAKVRIPSYRWHKARNLAVVTINGHDHYLGEYGSVESRQKYGELIAKHAVGLSVAPAEAAKAAAPSSGLRPCGITINELVLAYFLHADAYYRKNGVRTDEYACQESACRPLILLYGDTDVGMFGGMAMGAVIKKMIDLGWSRGYINKSAGRIRKVFRYGLAHDMFPADIVQRLEAVPPLLKGRTDAVELPKRTTVPAEHIELVRNDVNQHTRDLLDLALLVGARPGELCCLTGEMIDRTKDIWLAELVDHKMAHKVDEPRILAFAPKAQLILRRYLKADPRRKLFPITRKTFSQNLKAACLRLDLPVFTGHWLRHNALTGIRRELDLDSAQVVAGHRDTKTTEIYAHLEPSQLIEIARKLG